MWGYFFGGVLAEHYEKEQNEQFYFCNVLRNYLEKIFTWSYRLGLYVSVDSSRVTALGDLLIRLEYISI